MSWIQIMLETLWGRDLSLQCLQYSALIRNKGFGTTTVTLIAEDRNMLILYI